MTLSIISINFKHEILEVFISAFVTEMICEHFTGKQANKMPMYWRQVRSDENFDTFFVSFWVWQS